MSFFLRETQDIFAAWAFSVNRDLSVPYPVRLELEPSFHLAGDSHIFAVFGGACGDVFRQNAEYGVNERGVIEDGDDKSKDGRNAGCEQIQNGQNERKNDEEARKAVEAVPTLHEAE